MVKQLSIVFLAGVCLAGCTATSAQGKTETITVTGKVVDLVCYARNKANIDVDHDDGRVCAIACIKWEGNPAGIVTAEGKAYQLAGALVARNNAEISKHIAHTVTITGTTYEKDGMAMLSADTLTMVKQ
jgi:hypothetical protein